MVSTSPQLVSSGCVRRQQGEAWGGQGLLELQKPHKSRLTREKEAWAAEVHHLRGSNGITATP